MKKGEDTRFLRVGVFTFAVVFSGCVHTIAIESSSVLLFVSLMILLNRHGRPISSSAMPTKPTTSVE